LRICIASIVCKMRLSRMLRTRDRSLDDEAKRAVSTILQNGDLDGLLSAFQTVGMPSDSRHSDLFEIEFGRDEAQRQANELFGALANRNDRKPILMRPGWDTLCRNLKGNLETRAGTIHPLLDATLSEHEWLLSQIDTEIVNEETFNAIFQVVVMWRIARTLHSLKVSSERRNRLRRCVRCCGTLLALEEPIRVSTFNVWVNIEGAGLVFSMLWGESSSSKMTRRSSSSNESSTQSSICVGIYEGMESHRLQTESEANVLDATTRRLAKPSRRLLPKKLILRRRAASKVVETRENISPGSIDVFAF